MTTEKMTAAEFVRAGITGQTFREITEKFGRPWAHLSNEDPSMANFALGFAHIREREHLPVPDAFSKAMSLTTAEIEAFFIEETKETKAAADFGSPPPTTTP